MNVPPSTPGVGEALPPPLRLLPPADWLAPFATACRDLMSSMCGVEVRPRALAMPDGTPPFVGISSRIEFSGPGGRGSLTIRFAREIAARYVARFLRRPFEGFDADAADAMAEFANMVAGRACQALPFDARTLGAPAVSFDAAAAPLHAGGTHAALLAFDSGEGAFTAEIWFDRSPAPHPGP